MQSLRLAYTGAPPTGAPPTVAPPTIAPPTIASPTTMHGSSLSLVRDNCYLYTMTLVI